MIWQVCFTKEWWTGLGFWLSCSSFQDFSRVDLDFECSTCSDWGLIKALKPVHPKLNYERLEPKGPRLTYIPNLRRDSFVPGN